MRWQELRVCAYSGGEISAEQSLDAGAESLRFFSCSGRSVLGLQFLDDQPETPSVVPVQEETFPAY